MIFEDPLVIMSEEPPIASENYNKILVSLVLRSEAESNLETSFGDSKPNGCECRLYAVSSFLP
jgi:hypothetical protein